MTFLAEQMRSDRGTRIHRTLTTLEPVGDVTLGYRVKDSDCGRYVVEVWRMLYNWRVVLRPKDCDVTVEGAWCYFGNGWTSLRNALLAAAVWSGDPATEPPGYDKRAGSS